MNRAFQRRPLKAKRAAVTLVACMLIASFSFGTIPLLESASAAPVCQLACCAGMSPHGANTCMGGSCHAGLISSKAAYSDDELSIESEALCGLESLTITTSVLAKSVRELLQTSDNDSHHSNVAPAALVRPCAPECGTVSSSSNQNRSRNSLAPAYADQTRPPSATNRSCVPYPPNQTLESVCRLHAPRAPPFFIS